MHTPLKVAARSSPLSRAQVKEVLDPLGIPYETSWIETYGDQDRTQSLRTLDKTDFFTREVDAKLLSLECDIAIHSAKDLPLELPEGLKIIALTKGVDSSDSLVLRKGITLNEVKKVATSSERREEAVKALKDSVEFCDIRGTIQERIDQLESGHLDGVVIAEAALLRLGLNPPRLTLPGTTTPLQGQLAIVARHDFYMPSIEALDSRVKDTLYLGLRCSNPLWHHFPIIRTQPLPFEPVANATHYIFTSRTAVKIYSPFIEDKPIFCTGAATARELPSHFQIHKAENEQAEGVVELLDQANLKDAHIVWPRSAQAREVISKFKKENVKLTEIPLYTISPTTLAPPSPTPFKTIYFTSPSCVDAYITLYGSLPSDKQLISIGAITQEHLESKFK